MSGLTFAQVAAIVVAVAGCVTDLRNRRIPNVLTFGAAAGAFQVLGPAPAPLGRLRGEYRAQIFLKGTRRTSMREALQQAVAAMPDLQRRVTIDIDPLSVM